MAQQQSQQEQPNLALSLFGGGGGTPPTATTEPPAEPKLAASQSMALDLFGASEKPESAPAPAPEPEPMPIAPTSGNMAIQLFGGAPKAQEQADLNDPSKDYTMSEDEPWYSRTWAYLNKPLYDAHQWGWQNGFGQGVEDIVTGLTSPTSIGLTVGGLGMGALFDVLGVTAEQIPTALKGFQALMDTGFTVQQARAVLTQVPQALDALKFGDYKTAERLGTDALAGTAFTAAGGIGALHRWGEFGKGMGWVKPSETLEGVRKAWGNRNEALQEHITELRRMDKDLYNRFHDAAQKAGIKDEGLALGAMKRWMGVGGDAAELERRRNALAGTLDPAERDSVLEAAKELAPEEARAVEAETEGRPETGQERPAEEPETEPRIPIHPQESAFTAMLRQNAEQMKARTREELIEDAVKHFGVTDDVAKTGYVLPDGRGLDFSAKNAGRTLSHEAINEVGGLPEADKTGRSHFMADTGSMRTHIADGQVNVEFHATNAPTESQIDWIRRALDENPHSTFLVDISNDKGVAVGTAETEDAEARDIGRTINEARKKVAAPESEPEAAPKEEVVPQEAKPTGFFASLPPREDFIPAQDVRKFERSHYFDEEGVKKASSRTTPQGAPPWKLGQWKIDDVAGGHGHLIEQLQEIDPNKLESTENPREIYGTGTNRGEDVDRYKQWLQEGKEPPPISAVQTEQGNLRIVDGHRRWLAAKELGVPVKVWVSPIADIPGMVTPKGEPIGAGLTYEMAQEGVEPRPLPDGTPVVATEKTVSTGAKPEEQLQEPEPAPVAENKEPNAAEVAENPESGQAAPTEAPAEKPPVTNEGFQQRYTPEERARLLAKYDLAQKLPPELQQLAGELREMFDTDGHRAQENGMLRDLIDDYVTNVWQPGGKDQAGFWKRLFSRPKDLEPIQPVEEFRHQAQNGAFDTNFPFARKRVFESEHQGEMLGYKQAIDDPIALAMNYRWRLEKALADRGFLETLRQNGLQMDDGSPVVAIAGNGRLVGEESGNPKIAIQPHQMRGIDIDDDVVKGLAQSGKLRQLVDQGRITQSEKMTDKGPVPVYRWNTGDYSLIDHNAFRGWHWVRNAPDGTPVLMQGELRVHPKAADFIRRAVGAEKSAIRETALGRAALRGSSEAKHLLLSLSPFHLVQEGLRGIMAGINPFFSGLDLDFQNEPLLRRGVANGLTLYRDYNALERYAAGRNGEYSREGVGGKSTLLNTVPGLRDIQDHLQNFLFDRYIPALKSRAFKSYFDRYRDAMPAASPDEVARAAASRTNEMFGGLNYVDLGRSATNQDIFRLAALAPDWLESEIRLLGRTLGFKGATEAKISAIDNARIVGTLMVTAQLLNLLVSGKIHPETPLGVVEPGKNGRPDTVVSLRTLPTDLIHALSDPRGFVMGRLNPLTIRTLGETVQGRDQYGRKVTPIQEIGDFVQNIAPIPSQTAVKRVMNQVTDLSNPDQIAKAAGFTVYHYRTEAEKVAQEKASNNTTTGPVDPRNLQKHLRDIRLEDMLRNNQVTKQQLYKSLPKREADGIIDYATLTPLQARFKRLPLKDALDVWDVAQPEEKDALHKMLWQKRYNWLRAHMHNGAVDDPSDPTWIRLQHVFPDLQRIK